MTRCYCAAAGGDEHQFGAGRLVVVVGIGVGVVGDLMGFATAAAGYRFAIFAGMIVAIVAVAVGVATCAARIATTTAAGPAAGAERMRIRAFGVFVLALRKIAVRLSEGQELRLIGIVLYGQPQRDLWNKLVRMYLYLWNYQMGGLTFLIMCEDHVH